MHEFDAQFWVHVSEILRNVGIIVGGSIGIWLGWRRVSAADRQSEAQARQADVARLDHVADLFNRAVGQLNDKNLGVRLGAIYTLNLVRRDFPDLSEPIVQLLTTYLEENPVKERDKKPPADVSAIIKILADKKTV